LWRWDSNLSKPLCLVVPTLSRHQGNVSWAAGRLRDVETQETNRVETDSFGQGQVGMLSLDILWYFVNFAPNDY
jgi:hypothetical protein